EGLQESGAGVGGGAAAEADDDLAGSGADGGEDQLAEPAGGRIARGELLAGERLQADGVGELEHGGGALERPDRLARLSCRAGDRGGLRRGAGGEGRIDRAVAAVGDRAGGDLGVRGRGGDPAGEGGDDVGGGEGALELVGGEEEAGHAVLAICSTVSDGWDMAKARAAVADVMALVGILRKQSHACSLGPRL